MNAIGMHVRKAAIVYHSAHGHTEHIAHCIARGSEGIAGTRLQVLKADAVSRDPESLAAFDGLILGSPTYLGGVSGTFKSFMDATGRMWKHQQLRGKLAAGFTVSALPAGDKQSTLLSMFVFAMQHGMIWVGNPIVPEQHAGVPYEQAANRLGSWSGLMVQGGHSLATADAFVPGDIRTARMFGATFARALQRISPEFPVASAPEEPVR